MLKHIKEFQKYVIITGFREIKIGDVDRFLKNTYTKKSVGVEIQFFDTDEIATWQHLYFAALNALTAFKNMQNVSKSVAMEAILYASAQHQIKKATKIVGVKPDSSNIAVLIIGDTPRTVKATLTQVSKSIETKADDSVLELTRKKSARIKKNLGITKLELETVEKQGKHETALIDLVIERMALLSTER